MPTHHTDAVVQVVHGCHHRQHPHQRQLQDRQDADKDENQGHGGEGPVPHLAACGGHLRHYQLALGEEDDFIH